LFVAFVGSVYKSYRTKPVNGIVKTIPNIHIPDKEEQLTTKDVSRSSFLCIMCIIYTHAHTGDVWYDVTQYSVLPRSLPIRPTHPASRVTQLGLPTSEADEFIREEGSATYTHTRLIIESSATLSSNVVQL